MTIQEAIKSGKPFKEPQGKEWYVVDEDGYLVFESELMSGIAIHALHVDALLADDWEIRAQQSQKGEVKK